MTILNYFLEYNRYMSILGIAVILGIAWIFSHHKRRVNYAQIAKAIALQILIAVLVLKTTIGNTVVSFISAGVGQMYLFADAGISFVFGDLARPDGAWGFIFGIKVLPIIIFFGAFMSLLFYYGIVQRLVAVINWAIRPILGTSGAETLCATANSFLGQTEAPLLVRNYLKDMTDSEMLVVMVSGMATISGAILAVFAAMGVPAEHMLAASVMAIPGSIAIAKILLPETETSKTGHVADVAVASDARNVLDAVSSGTSDGLNLALNVGAMLIAFLSLFAMINAILGGGTLWINDMLNIQLPVLTLESIFAYICAPFGYLLGFTGEEALLVGGLIGTKVALNELIAYGNMVSMEDLPQRVVDVTTYALCGFSNFSCIGIQIGGIGALVPEKRHVLTKLGLYAVLGGTLANLLSAMIAALVL